MDLSEALWIYFDFVQYFHLDVRYLLACYRKAYTSGVEKKAEIASLVVRY